MPPRLTSSTMVRLGKAKSKDLSSVRKRWNQKKGFSKTGPGFPIGIRISSRNLHFRLKITSNCQLYFLYIFFWLQRFRTLERSFDFAFPNPTPGAACQAGRHWVLFFKYLVWLGRRSNPKPPSLRADTLTTRPLRLVLKGRLIRLKTLLALILVQRPSSSPRWYDAEILDNCTKRRGGKG